MENVSLKVLEFFVQKRVRTQQWGPITWGGAYECGELHFPLSTT